MVRDLGRRLGKRARLHIEGEGTQLDALLVERLADPIAHLLRNALDHGIEFPEVREAAGKAPQGELWLRASSEGATVLLEVEDDGAGLDLPGIRARAAARGASPPGEEPDPVRLAELLAAPGFTTREVVSEVSGRGVGLDVVRRAAEDLSGELRVEPRPTGGTRFTLRFPLTRAMTSALLVGTRGQVYGLPLNHVVEVLRREEVEATERPGRAPAVEHDGRAYELVQLAELLEAPEGPAGPFLVLVRVGSHELALGVEALLEEASLVVQPLTPHLPEVPGVAGAAARNDGRVVLVLDVAGVARRSRPPG